MIFLAFEISRQDKDSLTYRYPLIVSFGFGLLHGLGFASALGEIGLVQNEILASLLFFNLGVEAGQVAFILVFCIALWILGKAISGKALFAEVTTAQRADMLLLDEPFNGVDVRTEQLMAQLFLQFRDEGRTILISTHDLGHVRDFCDLVVLINKTVLAYGETSEVFTPENLAMTFGGVPPDLLTGNSSPEETF